MFSHQAVAVFSRTPVLGQVKTRLQPELNVHQALHCHQLLLQQTLKNIQSKRYRIELWTWPEADHPYLQQLRQQYAIDIMIQSGNDLGQRMYQCMEQHVRQGEQIVLIGSDCPTMDAEYISNAFDALKQHDVVLGPAHDGGYVLIGANKIDKQLFENIQWGSEVVYQQTIEKLRQCGLSHYSLTPQDDIDSYDDLVRYPQLLHQL